MDEVVSVGPRLLGVMLARSARRAEVGLGHLGEGFEQPGAVAVELDFDVDAVHGPFAASAVAGRAGGEMCGFYGLCACPADLGSSVEALHHQDVPGNAGKGMEGRVFSAFGYPEA